MKSCANACLHEEERLHKGPATTSLGSSTTTPPLSRFTSLDTSFVSGHELPAKKCSEPKAKPFGNPFFGNPPSLRESPILDT